MDSYLLPLKAIYKYFCWLRSYLKLNFGKFENFIIFSVLTISRKENTLSWPLSVLYQMMVTMCYLTFRLGVTTINIIKTFLKYAKNNFIAFSNLFTTCIYFTQFLKKRTFLTFYNLINKKWARYTLLGIIYNTFSNRFSSLSKHK